MVVPLADTSAQPDAVVVELHHTVVADVAVSTPLGSEDHASLAKFQTVEHVCIGIHIVNSLLLRIDLHVFLVHGFLVVEIELLNKEVKVWLVYSRNLPIQG